MIVSQCCFINRILVTIDEHQFVFIQLNFHRFARIQNCNTAATIVQQQIFKVIQNALQHRHINLELGKVFLELAQLLGHLCVFRRALGQIGLDHRKTLGQLRLELPHQDRAE